jgi:hypothetical protein
MGRYLSRRVKIKKYNPVLKIFLFITCPIWGPIALFIMFFKILWDDISEWVDKNHENY